MRRVFSDRGGAGLLHKHSQDAGVNIGVGVLMNFARSLGVLRWCLGHRNRCVFLSSEKATGSFSQTSSGPAIWHHMHSIDSVTEPPRLSSPAASAASFSDRTGAFSGMLEDIMACKVLATESKILLRSEAPALWLQLQLATTQSWMLSAGHKK